MTNEERMADELRRMAARHVHPDLRIVPWEGLTNHQQIEWKKLAYEMRSMFRVVPT